ncbi:MAG: hypothetical protein ACP5O0_10175 [Acidimicrobiales bacterium]
MDRPGLGVYRRVTISLGLVLALGVLISACAPSSGGYANQACQLVHRSISLYRSSQETGAHNAQGLQGRALTLLRQALPLAALAASTNGSWQALQATLSETNRVNEGKLINALTQQCSAGGSTSNSNFNIPTSSTSPS